MCVCCGLYWYWQQVRALADYRSSVDLRVRALAKAKEADDTALHMMHTQHAMLVCVGIEHHSLD